MAEDNTHAGTTIQRLDRVEIEVSEIRTGMVEMRTELRGLSSFMARIERALESRDRDDAEDRKASRPNIIAIVAVLISIISALIGGAWLIGGQNARFDERDRQRDREMGRVIAELDRVEKRQWDSKD